MLASYLCRIGVRCLRFLIDAKASEDESLRRLVSLFVHEDGRLVVNHIWSAYGRGFKSGGARTSAHRLSGRRSSATIFSAWCDRQASGARSSAAALDSRCADEAMAPPAASSASASFRYEQRANACARSQPQSADLPPDGLYSISCLPLPSATATPRASQTAREHSAHRIHTVHMHETCLRVSVRLLKT